MSAIILPLLLTLAILLVNLTVTVYAIVTMVSDTNKTIKEMRLTTVKIVIGLTVLFTILGYFYQALVYVPSENSRSGPDEVKRYL